MMTTKNSTAPGTTTPKRRRVVSNAVSASREAISVLAFNWQQTEWSQRAGWEALGKLIGTFRGKPALTAYQAYVSVNTVTFGQLGTDGIVQDAPTSLQLPDALPSTVSLTATLSSGATSALAINIQSPGYDFPVAVYAINPVTASFEPADGTQWTKITSFGSLPSGAHAITQHYVGAFGPVGVGAKILVRLQPINPSGFRGFAPQRSAIVLHLVSDASETGPETSDGGTETSALHVG